MSTQEWADKAIKYFVEHLANMTAPENFHSWIKKFKDDSKYDKSEANVRATISRKLEKIEEMSNYTLNQKVQLLFVLSQPVSRNFQEIIKDAKCCMELDENRRITLFCSADDKLIRNGYHGARNKPFSGGKLNSGSTPISLPKSSNQPSTSNSAIKTTPKKVHENKTSPTTPIQPSKNLSVPKFSISSPNEPNGKNNTAPSTLKLPIKSVTTPKPSVSSPIEPIVKKLPDPGSSSKSESLRTPKTQNSEDSGLKKNEIVIPKIKSTTPNISTISIKNEPQEDIIIDQLPLNPRPHVLIVEKMDLPVPDSTVSIPAAKKLPDLPKISNSRPTVSQNNTPGPSTPASKRSSQNEVQEVAEKRQKLTTVSQEPLTRRKFLEHLERFAIIMDSSKMAQVLVRIRNSLRSCGEEILHIPDVNTIIRAVVVATKIPWPSASEEVTSLSQYVQMLRYTILMLNSEELETSDEELKVHMKRLAVQDKKIPMSRIAQGIDQLLVAAMSVDKISETFDFFLNIHFFGNLVQMVHGLHRNSHEALEDLKKR
ncbi:hypothetical protein L3Y34_009606 [Caenorhabditis briggsae]|uniref:SPK domain-containing protein n=1 Tax=Caenorhabditis briggsae TaxID=6238 RepID=A0AAE9A329_CAEBR|nr:hypothetical protein L3Y34_009606 [Caenorhabditis briggsae]